MIPLMFKEDQEIIEMAKKNPEEFYKKVIESLLDFHDEDRITIYSLLFIIIRYIEGENITDEDNKMYHVALTQILDNYNVSKYSDLEKYIRQHKTELAHRKFKQIPVVGGVQ